MKKYLYVLKVKTQSFVIFENKSMKYFEEGKERDLEKLYSYLKDKITFKNLITEKEKNIEYYGEQYVVKIVSVEGFGEVLDRVSIKVINDIEKENLTYKDVKLLDCFYIYGFSFRNVKNGMLQEKESKSAKKNFYISLIAGILAWIFCMTGDSANYMGISYPISIFFIAGGSIYSIGKVEKIKPLGVYLIAVSMILSITYGIFTNSLLRFINFIAIPLILSVGLYLLNYANEEFNYMNFIYNILPNITIKLFDNKPFQVLGKVFFSTKFKKTDDKNKAIQKGVLISIPLILVLIYLLSSADPFFGEIFKEIRIKINIIIMRLTINGLFLKTILGLIVFVILFCFLNRLKFKEIEKIKEIKKYFDVNTVNTVLIMVDILYGFFTFVQVKSLFIRYSGTLSAEKYSEYAREGFFQLTAVVIINIFIILISQNKVRYNKRTNILNTIMTVISMGMTVSSIYKMNLYIAKFGFTRLRFVTSIFMMFVLVSLLFILVYLWRKINLFKCVILVGSIFYLLINFANMDKFITRYNLNKVQGEVDVKYLSILSKDSVEEMKKGYIDGKVDQGTYFDYIGSHISYENYKWFEFNYYNNK